MVYLNYIIGSYFSGIVPSWGYRILRLTWREGHGYLGQENALLIFNTVKTGIIESCAMSLRIPYFRRRAKNTAKEERLSLSERHNKTKKHQTLPEGATLTTQHTTRLF